VLDGVTQFMISFDDGEQIWTSLPAHDVRPAGRMATQHSTSGRDEVPLSLYKDFTVFLCMMMIDLNRKRVCCHAMLSVSDLAPYQQISLSTVPLADVHEEEGKTMEVRAGEREGSRVDAGMAKGSGAADGGEPSPKVGKRPSVQPHRYKPARRKFSHRFTSKKQLKSAQQHARRYLQEASEGAESRSLSTPHIVAQGSPAYSSRPGLIFADGHEDSPHSTNLGESLCNGKDEIR